MIFCSFPMKCNYWQCLGPFHEGYECWRKQTFSHFDFGIKSSCCCLQHLTFDFTIRCFCDGISAPCLCILCKYILLSKRCSKVPAGQSVAIVGQRDSGASALIGLLLRLHNPDSGEVLDSIHFSIFFFTFVLSIYANNTTQCISLHLYCLCCLRS